MNQEITIQGMHCQSCVGRIKKQFLALDGVTDIAVDLPTGRSTISTSTWLDNESIKTAVSSAGNYTVQVVDSEQSTVLPDTSIATYKPLIIIVAYILLGTAIAMVVGGDFSIRFGMRVFMGLFFLVFSFFKLLDLGGFATAYQSYDIISKRWKGWGYLYPFVELILGIGFLIGWNPKVLAIATIVVLGISSIGVIQSVLNKTKIQCACIGTGFNLPMSTVTIIEDLGMVVMAVFMLL